MLDTGVHTLLRVAQRTDHHPVAFTTFSASKLFLVLWQPFSENWTCTDQLLGAHSYSGQCFCSFWDPKALSDPQVAHVSGN